MKLVAIVEGAGGIRDTRKIREKADLEKAMVVSLKRAMRRAGRQTSVVKGIRSRLVRLDLASSSNRAPSDAATS
jgi:phosphoribosylformimino-5-aminoimidazole carboxamide ribonucleotide (ProFAR) isomerase